MLDEADQATSRLEWARVRDLCDGVLRLDPANRDALTLLGAANRDTGVARSHGSDVAVATPEVGITSATVNRAAFGGGRYVVKRALGEGAKKRVFLVHDATLEREVAFALIRTEGLDQEAHARVLREARVMGRLGEHPNIMPVHELGLEDGVPYFVMPLMDGDLEEVLRKAPDHRPPPSQWLEIANGVLAGLEFAHSHGVIHRDLKPGNIWLRGDRSPRIGDFGLALLAGTRLTRAGLMMGTAAYMPPEQATGGEITPRSDLYSFGCVLYEMVAGRPPFLGEDHVGIIGQHINTPPVSPAWHNAACVKPLEALIMRLLAKDPLQRPDSARAVRESLMSIKDAILDATQTSTRVVRTTTSGLEKTAGSTSGSLEALADGVFVGRQAEVAALRTALEGALSGDGGLVMVAGPSGVGKSRISVELATYATLRRCQVLWGRCYEGSGAPAYWPWVQAIRAYVRAHDPQKLKAELGTRGAAVAEIVTEISDRIPGLEKPVGIDSPEAARFRLFDSLSAFLQSASKAQPLLIILDDLQWADKPSLLLLEFLARESEHARMLILGTYRNDGLSRQHPLTEMLGGLNRERLFHRIELAGLDQSEVIRFIEMSTGTTPPADLGEAVFRRTDGNPMFVSEVVKLLVQDGAFARGGTRERRAWTVRIPNGVREVVGRRLNMLSSECNETLLVAAALGREFTLSQVGSVIEGVTPDGILVHIEEAVAARVLDEAAGTAETFRFANSLVREALLGDLSVARRARLHARVALSLEKAYADRPGGPVAQLAEHFEAAISVLGPDKVIKYSLAAGERALARLAHEEALEHFQRAAKAKSGRPANGTQSVEGAHQELGVTDLISADLLSGTASASAATHRREGLQHSVDALTEAFDYYQRAGERDKAVASVLRFPLPKVHGTAGVSKLLSDAVSLVDPTSLEAGKLLCRLGLFLSFERGDYQGATHAFARAVEISRRTHDTGLEIQCMINSAIVEWTHLRADRAVALSLQAIDLAAHPEDAQSRFEAHEIASVASGALGKSLAAQAHAASSLRFATQVRSRLGVTLAVAAGAEIATYTGNWAEARRISEGEHGNGRTDQRVAAPLAWMQFQLGDDQPALDLISGLVARNVALSNILIPLAAHLAAGGSTGPDISEVAQRARMLVGGPSQEPFHHMIANVVLGLIAVRRHDAGAARDHYAALQELAFNAVPHAGLSVERIRGLLSGTFGDAAAAAGHYESALTFCREAKYRPELAWTCHDYAMHLLEQGETSKAFPLIHEGSAIAIELGMRPLLAKMAGLWSRVSDPSAVSALREPAATGSQDDVTGLVGRRQLLALLALDIELLRQRQIGVALVRVDLDDFSSVNDAFGTAAGDGLLREVAEALRAAAPPTSTVARTGPDDFLIVLRMVTAEQALGIAVKLTKAASAAYAIVDEDRVRTTCTTGVLLVPEQTSNADVAIGLAEESVKAARRLGATSVHFYDPAPTDRKANALLHEARFGIVSALEEDRFVIVRMPIFRVTDRVAEHFEVLVRMKNRDGGLTSPTEFIPQAETLDLIQQIDRRVAELTMDRWRAYADAGQPLSLSMNVSARSISKEFLDFVVGQADSCGVPREQIILELTETAVMRDERGAERLLAAAKEAGFKLAMDDFGSGATSLKRVRSLNFDYLKLDGSLIRELGTSVPDRDFVAALAKLAHDSGLQLIAEFVSDEATLQFLNSHRVEYAQGWFLGKPEDFPARP